MAQPKFLQGATASVDVIFRESSGGPYVDPADARFDVLDPNDITMASDIPTDIVFSPGRHRGQWAVPEDADLGVWTMRFKATINDVAVESDCTFEVVDVPVVIQPGAIGPCEPWPIDLDCCVLPEAATPAMIARWRMVATEHLWAASGRSYGPCEVTVRPCLKRCVDQALFLGGNYATTVMGSNGVWSHITTCGCSGSCSCGSLCEIKLEGPVSEVISVTIGEDEVLDWRLDRVGESSYLVRTGGNCWPSCQDMGAEIGEEGAFAVTYTKGLPISDAGIAAVTELTCELVKSCIPGCECRLPRNVQQKTRSGTSLTFDTSKPWIRNLPLVAAWLDAVNPNGLARPMRVMSPDMRGTRRV